MYNGIGLQTPRGSGTNGYIQANKFLVKSRQVKTDRQEFQEGQGTGGVSRKANKEILEHDRKRQIELKLMVLEDALVEQGYPDEEVLEQVEAARKLLESADVEGGPEQGSNDSIRLSETQTHQVAARKEKKLDILKAALGLQEVKEGEAFDRELQEQRKQERILAREEKEREWKQKQLNLQKEQELKESESNSSLKRTGRSDNTEKRRKHERHARQNDVKSSAENARGELKHKPLETSSSSEDERKKKYKRKRS